MSNKTGEKLRSDARNRVVELRNISKTRSPIRVVEEREKLGRPDVFFLVYGIGDRRNRSRGRISLDSGDMESRIFL